MAAVAGLRGAAPVGGAGAGRRAGGVNVATHATPAGPFTVVADDEGVVVASGWTTTLGEGATRRRDVGAASRALRAYLTGELDAIDAVVVRQSSGPVVERGWEVLRSIAPGAPITYTELARRCGVPGSARAASAACGRNMAALFVPCHRVVRTSGALGGFRWGLEVKRWLLAFEAACSVRNGPEARGRARVTEGE